MTIKNALAYEYAEGQAVEIWSEGEWFQARVKTNRVHDVHVTRGNRSTFVPRGRLRPYFDLLDRVEHAGGTWCVIASLGNVCHLKPEGSHSTLRNVSVYDIYPKRKTVEVGVPTASKSYKDTSKAPLEELLAVPDALEAVARVFRWAHDTKGYGFKQFETLDPSELRDALMRHTFQSGIKHMEVDDQSNMLHAVHMAANGLMYLQNLINRSKAAN